MLSPVLLVSLVTVIPSLPDTSVLDTVDTDPGCEDCATLTRHTVRHWLGPRNNGIRDKHIRHLSLTGRKIKHVAKQSFSELPHLKHLNLSHNVISHIDRNTFDNLSNLRQLSISFNHLKTLEKELFKPLTSLETLILDHNYLEDINEVFLVLGSLKHLSLVHNSVKWFDIAFFPKTVETINLSKNMIEEMGNYFKMLDGFSLRTLDLSYNRIFSLKARIFVESLEEINLEGNKISEIAAGTFVDLSNLRRVNLRQNSLKTVARNSLQLYQSLGMRHVYQLAGNPLLCDCSLEWTRSSPGEAVADLAEVTCDHHDLGVTSVLGAESFLCHYTTHCFSLCRCCTFLACDCRMNCPEACTCLHDESWNVNIIQCRARNLTSVPREIPMDATAVFLDRNRLETLGPEIFLGRSKVTTLYLNNSNINGLSNGTFLGLSALKQLYLSHNEIEKIESGHFSGLDELEVLRLDNNHISWIGGGLLGGLSQLRVLTLHSNKLLSLDLGSRGAGAVRAGMQLVTIHDNRWQCSSKTDCTWITQTVDTLNKSAVKYLNKMTCTDSEGEDQKLVSFVSSCRNLEMLPVSAQKATSPLLVIIVSVAVVVLLLVTTAVTVVLVQAVLRKRRPPRPPVTVYLHYSMSDDGYVRREVAAQLSRVTASLCYHHGDTSTQLSVGGAMAGAVQSSGAAVILASPAYIQSAVTGAELHILAECVMTKCGLYPVVVITPPDSAYSVHQIKEQFTQTVGCASQDWVFINDLRQLSSVLDRLLHECDTSWYGRLLRVCGQPSPFTVSECTTDDTVYSGNMSPEGMKAGHDTTLTTLISSSRSPPRVVTTRTLPHRAQSNVRNVVGLGLGTGKWGTARLYNNPLDTSRPDIIYHHPHHYEDYPSDNVYETISHCKNLKNSVI